MTRKWVRLYGPNGGTDEANFGEHRFVRHEDGHFDVLAEAVAGLCSVGGFTIAPASEQPPENYEPPPPRR
jgi:hypothetical protein